MTTRLSPKTPLADRLLSKHEVADSGCWMWTAARSAAGYGQLRVDGRTIYAHRASYEVYVGPIAEGMQIDHLCRERACINPSHLQVVTNRENTLRGDCGRINAKRMLAKTESSNGHPYTEANTYTRRVRGRTHRDCRACGRERMRAHRAAKEQA